MIDLVLFIVCLEHILLSMERPWFLRYCQISLRHCSLLTYTLLRMFRSNGLELSTINDVVPDTKFEILFEMWRLIAKGFLGEIL